MVKRKKSFERKFDNEMHQSFIQRDGEWFSAGQLCNKLFIEYLEITEEVVDQDIAISIE